MKVVFSPKAVDDLVSIRNFIGERAPDAASRVAVRNAMVHAGLIN